MSEESAKLDQKSEEEKEAGQPAKRVGDDQSSLPLFLRNKSEGDRGDSQDEKNESAE